MRYAIDGAFGLRADVQLGRKRKNAGFCYRLIYASCTWHARGSVLAGGADAVAPPCWGAAPRGVRSPPLWTSVRVCWLAYGAAAPPSLFLSTRTDSIVRCGDTRLPQRCSRSYSHCWLPYPFCRMPTSSTASSTAVTLPGAALPPATGKPWHFGKARVWAEGGSACTTRKVMGKHEQVTLTRVKTHRVLVITWRACRGCMSARGNLRERYCEQCLNAELGRPAKCAYIQNRRYEAVLPHWWLCA